MRRALLVVLLFLVGCPRTLPPDAGLVFGAECRVGEVWSSRGHRYLCVDDDPPRAVELLPGELERLADAGRVPR